MTSNRSLYAYEDEPYWAMCLREYVIPTIVFASLAYYLVFRVLLPMRRIERPTRRMEEEVAAAAAAAAASAKSRTEDNKSIHDASSASTEQKKDQ